VDKNGVAVKPASLLDSSSITVDELEVRPSHG
jgi:hypothetical protein